MAFDSSLPVSSVTVELIDQPTLILSLARKRLSDPAMWLKADVRYPNPHPAAPDQACAFVTIFNVCDAVRIDRRHALAAASRLVTALGITPHNAYQTIFAFNDHPDTTHAKILDLFDRAIGASS